MIDTGIYSTLVIFLIVLVILFIWAWHLGPIYRKPSLSKTQDDISDFVDWDNQRKPVVQTKPVPEAKLVSVPVFEEPDVDPEEIKVQKQFDRLYECHSSGKGSSTGECICREYLEKRFGKPFANCRPVFLKNPESDGFLELDCYNKDMKLAVEYQGKQHYSYPNMFHRTKNEFYEQLRRDKFKREMCEVMGIYLICVPYTVHNRKIPAYIEERLPYELKSLPWAETYWKQFV